MVLNENGIISILSKLNDFFGKPTSFLKVTVQT